MTQDVRYARIEGLLQEIDSLLHDAEIKANMVTLLAEGARWPRKREEQVIETRISSILQRLQFVHHRILGEGREA